MKKGVQKYLKKSAVADFRGNDEKGKFGLFTKPSISVENGRAFNNVFFQEKKRGRKISF